MATSIARGKAKIPADDLYAERQASSVGAGDKTSLEMCMKVLAGVQEQIRFADTKAAFVFGINTLMCGFVAGSLAALRSSLAHPPVSPCAWVGLVFLILFGLCAVFAVGALVFTVMSRFGAPAPKGRCFFGDIAATYGKDYGRYVNETRAMSDDDWLVEIAAQIVETSHIARYKHRWVRAASVATIIGLASWVGALFTSSLLMCP